MAESHPTFAIDARTSGPYPAAVPLLTSAVRESLGTNFDALYAVVHRFLAHCVFDAELAEELAAHTFYKAATARPLHDCGFSALQAWILRIAMNVATTHYRRRRLRHLLLGRLAESKSRPTPSARAAAAVASDEPDRVRRALLDLPPKSRAIVVLRYYLDYSYEDIGKVTGCRPDAARARLSRALKELRMHLVRHGIAAQ